MEGALDLSRVMYEFLTKNAGKTLNDNAYQIMEQWNHNLAKGPFIISLLDSYLQYTLNLPNSLS